VVLEPSGSAGIIGSVGIKGARWSNEDQEYIYQQQNNNYLV